MYVALVTNYPVISAITAVISVISVFWVRKHQMSGNAVTLCVHLLRIVSGSNYRQHFISTITFLTDAWTMLDPLPQTATIHHKPQKVHKSRIVTMSISINSESESAGRTSSPPLSFC